MIRGVYYWFIGGLVTLLWCIMLLIIFPFFPRRQDIFHNNARYWATFLLRVLCGVRFDVQGLENLQKGKSYIIVSNHRSYTDILVGNATVLIQFRWLAKKSLFKVPAIGWVMRFAGYIPVVRERAVSASRSLDRTADVLRSGVSVWIFPEGTRTPGLKLGAFKRGAFRLARETGTPILPVVFINTDRIFTKPYRVKPQQVEVRVLEAIDPAGFRQSGMNERAVEEQLMEAVRDVIQRSYDARASRSS
jgi:1-acyl-sn-glycerol-3-phosphate acyltransferase